jgi:hypothetical protein
MRRAGRVWRKSGRGNAWARACAGSLSGQPRHQKLARVPAKLLSPQGRKRGPHRGREPDWQVDFFPMLY